MRFPIQLHLSMMRYLLSNGLHGVKRFPLVLMLEPTHQCNLNCSGCGRIREYADSLHRSLSLEECLASVDEAGAPVVTVTGGEPLILSNIGRIIRGIVDRGKHVFLCTNGTLLKEKLAEFTPDVRLTFNIHLDGFGEAHDRILGRRGVFESAVEAIRSAKEKGFRVSTNTTVYKDSDPSNLARLLDMLHRLDVDGMLVSPAFDYESVHEDLFLDREEIVRKFNSLSHVFDGRRMISSPIYLEFLSGKRDLRCTPWGNPTRNPKGWKSPCYLITDTHYASFEELMEKTDWDRYESGMDLRCRNCMVHCGFEPSVVRTVGSHPGDLIKMIRWNLDA
ncbi:MAG: adenosyl-hopene transferase HpnH [Deltaproteobacteria bacterium]|nr:adenosyl-hopene transferase HpnH [Deltaproteobacteria bacterium]